MKEIKLYQLDADASTTLRSLDFDACLDGYDPEVDPSDEMFSNIYFVARENRTVPFDVPIVMHGPLQYIQHKDILDVEPGGWIVVSSKFKALLERLQAVEQQFIPVRIYDGEVRDGDDLKKGAQRYTDDYSLLYLPTTLKIFNYRESEYSFSFKDAQGTVNFAKSKSVAPQEVYRHETENTDVSPKKTVLNIKEQDLPLYFRLPVAPMAVCVTERGYDLLKASGLNNLFFHYAQGTVYTME